LKKLILATNNIHKISEIQAILTGIKVEILSARDFPDFPEIEETGKTLAENASLKAKAVWERYHIPAIADDTGLEVDYLNGAPGVYSARFAGQGCTFDDNNKKLLDLLSGVPTVKRLARFKCVIAFIDEIGEMQLVEGILEGTIAEKVLGSHGFGYDPLFLVAGLGRTLAQLSAEEKNRISHRARALAKIKPIILSSYQDQGIS
jgi:XTP/dITP diphosphohydrolase